MKKVILVACAIAAAVVLTGCIAAPFEPPIGLYTDIKAPLSICPSEIGPKKGSAGSMSILGIVAIGDCSIAAAARNGGLTSIDYLDYEYFNVLGVYQRAVVNAYGK